MVHEKIEYYLGNKRLEDIDLSQYTEEQLKKSETGYNNFKNWIDQNKIEILYIEPNLVSEEYKYGGTPDLVTEMNNRFALIDWKSSRKVYSDYFLQLGGYCCLIKENYNIHIDDIHILRFSKSINGWDHIYRQERDWMWDAFKCCLDLHNYKKIAEESI